mgnify:CR=1 FL=1
MTQEPSYEEPPIQTGMEREFYDIGGTYTFPQNKSSGISKGKIEIWQKDRNITGIITDINDGHTVTHGVLGFEKGDNEIYLLKAPIKNPAYDPVAWAFSRAIGRGGVETKLVGSWTYLTGMNKFLFKHVFRSMDEREVKEYLFLEFGRKDLEQVLLNRDLLLDLEIQNHKDDQIGEMHLTKTGEVTYTED